MAEEQVQIKLKETFFASRKIRFLHLKTLKELLFKTNLCGEYLPLFLGADVLSNCSISVPNLPRTHAKFAKKGLATKIIFPSLMRINGIQGTGKGVWFYSIQGLFRVAFEMYSREEQLDLLKCLQGVWSSRIEDKLLGETVSPIRFDICEDKKEKMDSRKEKSYEIEIPTSNYNTSSEQFNKNCDRCCTNQRTPSLAKKISETVFETNQDQLPRQNFIEILPELTDLMTTSDNTDSEFNTVVTILRTLLQSYKTISLSLELFQLDYQEKFFYVMCHWVGNEFRKYKAEISQKVTEFKKRHIATIDSLPPAERVIEELFPQSMIVLLKTWMKDETQKQEEQRSILPFPLIQLILEFANQTLVSGVAHVLYSRLIRAECV